MFQSYRQAIQPLPESEWLKFTKLMQDEEFGDCSAIVIGEVLKQKMFSQPVFHKSVHDLALTPYPYFQQLYSKTAILGAFTSLR